VGGIHFRPSIDVERHVLDAHVVVVVLAAVGRSESQELIAVAEVHDFLGAAVGRKPLHLVRAERSQNRR